jgi:hypothetical protein
MSVKIDVSTNVSIARGPTANISRSFEVDAYDSIDAKVAAGTDQAVDVQPAAADRVQLLVITSDRYDAALTYTATAPPAPPAPPVPGTPLDAPVSLVGKGAVGLLGNDLKKLWIHNGTANDVTIKILVGRSA